MTQILRLVAVLVLLAMPALAQNRPAMDRLGAALRLDEIVDIMRREGLATADDLAVEMLGGPRREWSDALARIYDPARMIATVRSGMDEELGDDEADRISAFFSSELGARIIALELSAREAFMDEGIEQASNDTAMQLPETDPDRFALLEEFIGINNLVESNVVGAMNSNFAFFSGLAEGGMFGETLAEEDMLREIWSQEPEIRAETTVWLHSYLGLAYRPLSDEELQLYQDFSASDAGQAMNRALFTGFDRMFVHLSRALGLTLGRLARVEEL